MKQFKYGAYYAIGRDPAVRDLYRTEMEVFQQPAVGRLLRGLHAARRPAPAARHLERLPVARVRPPASTRGGWSTCGHRAGAIVIGGGFVVIPLLVYLTPESHAARRVRSVIMALDAKIPGGPLAEKWDRHQFESKLVNPANRRKYTIIVVGTGLAGASAAVVARRARLQRPELLHPGQPAARAQHRRAGRHQRREELPERRRQHLPAVLRHGQGRRLPLARGERLPAGAAERQHHRPVRRAGRAVRARVRRPARQPVVRRRAGVAHVLRARPDRPAAAARRLSVDDAAGRSAGTVTLFANREMLDLVVVDGQARGIIVPQPDDRRDRALRRPRGAALHRRLRHGLLPVDQRGELERHRRVARAQARRASSPTPATRRFTRPASRSRGDAPVEAHADEREPAQRRPRLGAEEAGRQASAGADPRGRARLLPRTPVSELRQPRAARRRVAQRQAGLRRGPRRRRQRPRGVPRFRGRDQAARRRRHQGRATATSSTCTRRSPTRIRTRCRCGSTRPSTTRWAGSGSTTT